MKSDLARAQTRAGYFFILPSFVLYAVFVLAPVIVTFVLSFTYYDPMGGSQWVGLDNFHRFFTGDRSLQIFWNTLYFAIFAVAGNVTVGLLLALAAVLAALVQRLSRPDRHRRPKAYRRRRGRSREKRTAAQSP